MRNFARVLAVLLVCLVIGCASPALGAIIRVKWDSPTNGPGNDWDHAYHTVTAGLSAAISGDQVWVAGNAAHPYVERITLKSGVGLYGGFAGTESALGARDWNANVTVLDGNRSGTVVTVANGAIWSTIMSGFTITNGYGSPGGGVTCTGSSAIICNNIITRNSALFGGGIYSASPDSARIANNIITANTAQLGGGGIYASASSMRIADNTIVGNTASSGGGVYAAVSPGISNNIIAFNSSGVGTSSGQPVLRNNCVYNPDGENYLGMSAGTGDIQVDPGLVAAHYGRLHLQSGSPCINTGYGVGAFGQGLDMDGQTRVRDGVIDIGADESDGTTWVYAPVTMHVSQSGNDSNDGSSWSLAKRTVQTAIDNASILGGEVWVASGVYNENIKLPPYVYLYGSFSGTESAISERDASARTAILDGGHHGSVVYMVSGYRLSSIDGFVLRNGSGVGGGVYCNAGAPTLSNLTITGNTGMWGGGIYATSCFQMRVSGCAITANKATSYGGGVCNSMGMGVISDCAIIGNSAPRGGGAYCYNGRVNLLNNTITANTATDGGGIYCTLTSPEITNNVIAFNSSGIVQVNVGTPVLKNNCVHNPAGYNYSNISPGAGDISVDPQFLAPWAMEYHLRPTSPCIGAGDNSVIAVGATDLDGKARIYPIGGAVDIGCYEYDATPFSMKTVGLARAVPEQFAVELHGKPITAIFSDGFYIEDPERVGGIRVMSAQAVTPGDLATIVGQTTLDGGERVLQPTTLSTQPGSPAGIPGALLVGNKSLGGGSFFWNQNGENCGQPGITGAFGLNNIGLLVRITGRVVQIDSASPATWFKIDDGSGVNVKCLVPSGVTIDSLWSYVGVTGISSCETVGAELHSLLRVRTGSDIVGY